MTEEHLRMTEEHRLKLEHRVSRLENTAWVLGALAVALGIGGASLWSKLSTATEKVSQLQSTVGNFKGHIESAITDAKKRIEVFANKQRADLSDVITSNFFGQPESKSFDQWHTAPTYGFIMVSVGGNGDTTVNAWVDADENKHAPNRSQTTGFDTSLQIVRKGEKFRAEIRPGAGQQGSLFWIPVASKPSS